MTSEQEQQENENRTLKRILNMFLLFGGAVFLRPFLNRFIKGEKVHPKLLENEINAVINEFLAKLEVEITTSVSRSWHIGEKSIKAELGNAIPKVVFNKLPFTHRNEAMRAFIEGKKNFSISNRVWRMKPEIKDLISDILERGVKTGQSAHDMTTTLRQFLKNPDSRFKRIRDKNGKLVPSKPMENYHPGSGVYRSSYRNALRLASNEINKSYRLAQHYQRLDNPVVIGFEVHTSNSHSVNDMCDYLKGIYPKGFVFSGWHVLCKCHCKSILVPGSDFDKFLSGEVDTLEAKQIETIPANFTRYVKTNETKIKALKTQPNWFTDNNIKF
jgi:hypothetical protein